jgi:hypothetical protein
MVPAGPSLADALEFYTSHLGFTIVWQDRVMAGVRRGSVQLNLIENEEPLWASNASFSIGVADLDSVYEEYKSIPAHVGPLEMKGWGRREFHMIVPSGVCLQFFEETK